MPDEVNKVLLGEHAYELIRSRILDCVLVPGSQVSERGLSTELGVGIAATRSALARLANDGLVTPIPRVGYQVAPITLRGVTAFFDVWSFIGPEFVRIAISRLTPEHRRQIAELPTPNASSLPIERTRFSDALWEILMDATENPLLNDIVRRLQAEMHRLFALTYRQFDGQREPLIPPLNMSASPEEARDAAHQYIEEARRWLMDYLLRSTSLVDVSLAF